MELDSAVQTPKGTSEERIPSSATSGSRTTPHGRPRANPSIETNAVSRELPVAARAERAVLCGLGASSLLSWPALARVQFFRSTTRQLRVGYFRNIPHVLHGDEIFPASAADTQARQCARSPTASPEPQRKAMHTVQSSVPSENLCYGRSAGCS